MLYAQSWHSWLWIWSIIRLWVSVSHTNPGAKWLVPKVAGNITRYTTANILTMYSYFPKNWIAHSMHPHAYHTHIQKLSRVYGVRVLCQEILNMQAPPSQSDLVALRPFERLSPWAPKSLRNIFLCANLVEPVSTLALFGVPPGWKCWNFHGFVNHQAEDAGIFRFLWAYSASWWEWADSLLDGHTALGEARYTKKNEKWIREE